MIYRLSACATFWFHCLLSLWIFCGVPVGLFFPRYALIHVIFLGSTLLCQWAYKWRCPLTTLGKAMLARFAPERVYEGAFLRYYIDKYFGVKIPPKGIARALVTVFIVSVTLWAINMLAGR